MSAAIARNSAATYSSWQLAACLSVFMQPSMYKSLVWKPLLYQQYHCSTSCSVNCATCQLPQCICNCTCHDVFRLLVLQSSHTLHVFHLRCTVAFILVMVLPLLSVTTLGSTRGLWKCHPDVHFPALQTLFCVQTKQIL